MTPCTICQMPATHMFAPDLPVCGSIHCDEALIDEINYLLEEEAFVRRADARIHEGDAIVPSL